MSLQFTEDQLEQMVRCPLLETRELYTDPYPVAKELLNWAVLEAFRDRLATVAQLRTKFEYLWTKWSDSHGIRDKEFYNGIRAGNGAARRIYLLLQEYQVVKPYGYYELPIEGYTFRGYYAVLSMRSQRSVAFGIPYVLVEHEYRPVPYLQPGVVEQLRHFHYVTSTSAPVIRILHFPVLRNEAWDRKNIDLSLERRYLLSIVKAASVSEFPAPGSHCDSCVSKGCRKVFYV